MRPVITGAQSPREVRRRQRIETSREQILDTAEELFAARGYHETSLRDVATRCQYSVGSLYTFFDNKDVLYEQVLMRRCMTVEVMRQQVPKTIPADVRLVRLAEIQIEHAIEHPTWGALTAEISRIARTRGAVWPEAWLTYSNGVHGFVEEVIAEGQSDGSLKPGSPAALARLYQAVLMAFILVNSFRNSAAALDDWSSDTRMILEFVHDTFSTNPHSGGRLDLDGD